MTRKYQSVEEAKQNPTYVKALVEFVYQLADDDLLISHRASEWLGLGPHIEEDVAFSSIAQDTLGHAVMFYQLLEELGEGRADDLTHLRKPEQFRNAILAERVNGKGHYRENPDFDWAYAIIRNYVYEVFKRIRLDAMEQSSFTPLTDLAAKIKREQFYHLYHWEVWIEQLSNSTEEAHQRLNLAIEKTWTDIATLYDLGPYANEITANGLMKSEEELKNRLLERLRSKLESVGLNWPGEPAQCETSGREGQHSAELIPALEELSEVYKLDPQACW